MSLPIEKFAPTAVVMAIVVWCCWPYFAEPASEVTAVRDAGLPSIGAELLRPTLVPPCSRDPFQPVDETVTVAQLGSEPATSREDGPDGAAPAEAGAPAAGQLASSRLAAGPAASSSPTGSQDSTLGAVADRILTGLVLDATYVRGSRRYAMINGRIYREGQPLESTAAERCAIKQILPGKVLLECRQQTIELVYRGLPDGKAVTDPSQEQPSE